MKSVLFYLERLQQYDQPKLCHFWPTLYRRPPKGISAAQPCAKAEGCVHDDVRVDKLRKGLGFRVGTWNVDSLTGRAGEQVEAFADREVDVGLKCTVFKKRDGEAVAAGSLELKARGISCCGWEVR